MEELEKRLNEIPGAYFEFVDSVLAYVRREPEQMDDLLLLVAEPAALTTSAVLKYLFGQPNFFKGCPQVKAV